MASSCPLISTSFSLFINLSCSIAFFRPLAMSRYFFSFSFNFTQWSAGTTKSTIRQFLFCFVFFCFVFDFCFYCFVLFCLFFCFLFCFGFFLFLLFLLSLGLAVWPKLDDLFDYYYYYHYYFTLCEFYHTSSNYWFLRKSE